MHTEKDGSCLSKDSIVFAWAISLRFNVPLHVALSIHGLRSSIMQISLHLMDLHLERMTALPAATTQLPENKTKPARQIQMVQSGRKHFGFYFHSELADLIARETSRDPVPFHRLSVINRKRD